MVATVIHRSTRHGPSRTLEGARKSAAKARAVHALAAFLGDAQSPDDKLRLLGALADVTHAGLATVEGPLLTASRLAANAGRIAPVIRSKREAARAAADEALFDFEEPLADGTTGLVLGVRRHPER